MCNLLHPGSWCIWWNTYVRRWRLNDWTAFLLFHLLSQGEWKWFTFNMHKYLKELMLTLLYFFFSFSTLVSTGQPGMFGRDEFEQLAPVIDGFSLMTYDYSSGARWVPGGVNGDSAGAALVYVSSLSSFLLFLFSLCFLIDQAQALLCPG